MSTSVKMIAIPLPVVPVARSTIAPPKAQPLDLPPPFKPQATSVTRQDLLDARYVAPFDLLPRMFILVPSVIYRPPVMHYGWPAPRQTLLTYAKEHGLVMMMRRRNPPLPDESDGESSDDDSNEASAEEGTEDNDRADGDGFSSQVSDESDGSGTVVAERASRTSKPLPSFFTKVKGMNIDVRPSMVAAMEHIFAQLPEKDGLLVPKTMDMYPTLQHGGGERQVISVYTNYHLLRKDVPSPGDIQKLGEAVGITTPPKWYIDQEKYEWYLVRDPYRR